MSHDGIEAGAGWSRGKPDVTDRELVELMFPTLGPVLYGELVLLDGELVELDDGRLEWRKRPREAVERAAFRVERERHRQLLHLEQLGERAGTLPPDETRRELELAAAFARGAVRMVNRWAPSAAKRVQLEASDGRPLAMCVGPAVHLVATIDGPLWVGNWFDNTYGVGCGRVFEDSTRTSARMFAVWCPKCNRTGRSRRRLERLERRGAAIGAAQHLKRKASGLA